MELIMHNEPLTPEEKKIVRRIRLAVWVVLWTIALGFFGFAGFLMWAADKGIIRP
jgi:hypothetical protein